MEDLILEKINDYCNDNFTWFGNTLECKDLEIYDDDYNCIAVVDFEVEVEVYQKPSYGSYYDPPESGECDFILYAITLHDLYNSKNKLLPNCKEKLQKLLEDKIGKLI
jgi:chromatin remodeling complex protein RSC6